MQEWIADQPEYVRLSCSHKENLTARGLIIIKAIAGVQVYCETCNAFRAVDKRLTLREYHNLPAVKTSDAPLF